MNDVDNQELVRLGNLIVAALQRRHGKPFDLCQLYLSCSFTNHPGWLWNVNVMLERGKWWTKSGDSPLDCLRGLLEQIESQAEPFGPGGE